MSEPRNRRPRFRLTIAGMMALVAISALVVFVYDREERQKRAKINRAIAVMKQARPDVDLQEFDSSLGKMSADGRFQQVEFKSREDRRKQIGIVIPIRDDSPKS